MLGSSISKEGKLKMISNKWDNFLRNLMEKSKNLDNLELRTFCFNAHTISK